MQAHTLIQVPNTRSQNFGECLSAIPEGLVFARKSSSHIRDSKGACGLQQISTHFPTHSISSAPQPHTTYHQRKRYQLLSAFICVYTVVVYRQSKLQIIVGIILWSSSH